MAYRRYIAVVLTVLLCGCSSPEPLVHREDRETVVLDILCPREEWDIVTQLCSDFAEHNTEKNYAFSLDVPPEDIGELRGMDADVLCFTSDRTEQLIHEGMLVPVTNDDDCLRPSVEAVERDGREYGFPYAADTYLLFYDRTEYNPKDTADLNRMMTVRLGDARYNIALPMDEMACQAGFFLAAGCDFPDGCCSEAGLLAGEYMAAISQSGRAAVRYGSEEIKAGFVDGSIAAAVTKLDDVSAIRSTLGSRLGVGALPLLTLSDGSSVQLYSLVEYRVAGVLAASDDAEDAAALARLISGMDSQRMRLEQLGYAPVSKELCGDKNITKVYPEVEALAKQLEYSVPVSSCEMHSLYSYAAAELCTALQDVSTREELSAALAEFRSTCNGSGNVVQ